MAKNGRGDKWLRIGGLKGFVDGSLGSHTAAMLAPFSDKPTDSGIFVTPLDSLFYYTLNADKSGLQVMVHAIGDSAIRAQLAIFDKVAKQNGDRDRRFRIEHAQHIAPGYSAFRFPESHSEHAALSCHRRRALGSKKLLVTSVAERPMPSVA